MLWYGYMQDKLKNLVNEQNNIPAVRTRHSKVGICNFLLPHTGSGHLAVKQDHLTMTVNANVLLKTLNIKITSTRTAL